MMGPRYASVAAVLGMMVVTSALAPRPHKSPVLQKPPSQALSPRWPAGIGAVAAAALAVAPQASRADASVLAETGDVSAWAASLGSQDKVAIVVLAFLVVVVIPALVSDLLETQKDPAAAIAKKQQKRVVRVHQQGRASSFPSQAQGPREQVLVRAGRQGSRRAGADARGGRQSRGRGEEGRGGERRG